MGVQALVVSSLASGVRGDSLWARRNPRSHDSLFTDDKAYRVGDLVTVVIQEESAIQNKEELDKEKDTKSLAEIVGFDFPKSSNASAVFTGKLPKFEFKSNIKHDGSGTYESSRKLVRTVTATVREVLPNGNLLIEARRSVVANGEKQLVTFAGIVRPADIASNNTVLSQHVSDVSVTVESKGTLSQVRIRGWLGKIIDFVWPF